jgi:hypothetical protein
MVPSVPEVTPLESYQDTLCYRNVDQYVTDAVPSVLVFNTQYGQRYAYELNTISGVFTCKSKCKVRVSFQCQVSDLTNAGQQNEISISLVLSAGHQFGVGYSRVKQLTTNSPYTDTAVFENYIEQEVGQTFYVVVNVNRNNSGYAAVQNAHLIVTPC